MEKPSNIPEAPNTRLSNLETIIKEQNKKIILISEKTWNNNSRI